MAACISQVTHFHKSQAYSCIASTPVEGLRHNFTSIAGCQTELARDNAGHSHPNKRTLSQQHGQHSQRRHLLSLSSPVSPSSRPPPLPRHQ
ncbi:uncharacterized protein CLUP02_14045 [Colletotrichum lupini]|uniref:Uncharacterized protein n=1 Tax=Colletotrichum lupini TaxID=145971 RepID=A0A9Q8WMX6_9PEZI|nr:uncharacterized protein CLUP02_14045 [Colletotrichum lupini]UQC88520.1 hypothetical protein CLUP02_14045 [Colletotrichum lupini]